MNRHRLLALLASTPAVAAVPAFAQTLQTVRIGTFASEATGQVFYAADRGFFKNRGIEGQINLQTAGAAGASAMLAGDLDVVEVDTVTLIKAHDKGLPFVFIAPGLLHSVKAPTAGVVTRDASPPAAYNGKTFATNALQNIAVVLGNEWTDRNGGDSKTLKWVEIPFPAMTAAVQRGVIEGFCAPEPFLSSAKAAGFHIDLLQKNPIAPNMLQGGWIATREWIAKNPATARAFVAACRDASDWANGDRRASGEIIVKYSKLPQEVIDGMVRGQYQDRLDPALIQPLVDSTAHYGFISKSFPASEIVVSL